MDTGASPDSARRLREELLNAGLIDWVSMSQADGRAAKYCPEVLKPQRQELVLDTLRELVASGLFTAGSLDTPDGRFGAFDEPLDEVMAWIRSNYVDHYDDTSRWVFRFWFELTDKGTAAAQQTERGREIARAVEADMRRLAEERQQP